MSRHRTGCQRALGQHCERAAASRWNFCFHANVIEFSFQFAPSKTFLCLVHEAITVKSEAFTTRSSPFVVAKICCSGCREIPSVHYLHFMPLLNIPKGKQTRLVRRQTTIKRFDEPRIHGRCLLWIIIDSLRVSFHFQWKHYYEIRR